MTTFPKRGEAGRRIMMMYMDMERAREPETPPSPVVFPDTCPKCGKRLGRGKYLHLKNCKGPKDGEQD